MHQTERSGGVGVRDVIKYFAKSEIMRPMFIVTYNHALKPIQIGVIQPHLRVKRYYSLYYRLYYGLETILYTILWTILETI